jgi:hypothetical protein
VEGRGCRRVLLQSSGREGVGGVAPQFDETMVSGDNIEVVSRPSGPVAQLGARFHGMEEVVGSIPTRSTKSLTNVSIRARVLSVHFIASRDFAWGLRHPRDCSNLIQTSSTRHS